MRQPISMLLHSRAEERVPGEGAILPFRDLGTTYSMAQELRWLDQDHFAIGRWDGTLTIFNHGAPPFGAPLISAALVAPSLVGIEMIARVRPELFASSNGPDSIVIWQTDGDFSATRIRILATLKYDAAIGPANDGAVTERDGLLYFVTGHAGGFALVWRVDSESEFLLLRELDLRSPNPIPSPFQLKNIRGVEPWKPGYVATGSEDGDLCLIEIPTGRILTRSRYNPSAERGINDIDICEDYLTVANCSVGPGDSNLWLFKIGSDGFTLLDSKNLKVDGGQEQVFNFCVDQGVAGGTQYFFSATQEGVVWIGSIEEGKLKPLGSERVSTNFGARPIVPFRLRAASGGWRQPAFVSSRVMIGPPCSQS